MSTTGEPSIEAAERLQGRTVEDSAAKQLPVPNVPDLSAFDMNGNLHMTSESMEKLHQASVLSWISTGMDSFLSMKNTGIRAIT